MLSVLRASRPIAQRVSLARPAVTSFRGFSTSLAPNEQPEGDLSSSLYDNAFDKYQTDVSSGDTTGRTSHYVALGASKALCAIMARVTVCKLVATMSASADVLALATLELNLNDVPVGTAMTTKWRGKPVFIRHRTQAEIDSAVAGDSAEMRDQETDAERNKDPRFVVVLGICTHLGCVPVNNAGEWGGWFCPCHGSHYDTSGRIRKGPAPLNLEVPPYSFVGGDKMVIG